MAIPQSKVKLVPIFFFLNGCCVIFELTRSLAVFKRRRFAGDRLKLGVTEGATHRLGRAGNVVCVPRSSHAMRLPPRALGVGQAVHHAGELADAGGHAAAGHRRRPPGRVAAAAGRPGPAGRRHGEAMCCRGPCGRQAGAGPGAAAAGEPRCEPQAGTPGGCGGAAASSGRAWPGRRAGGTAADACRPERGAELGRSPLAASR